MFDINPEIIELDYPLKECNDSKLAITMQVDFVYFKTNQRVKSLLAPGIRLSLWRNREK